MYLCYIDESGGSTIPGNTSHYVLTGLAVPVWYWKRYENEINKIKIKYELETAEIHTAWIMRQYREL